MEREQLKRLTLFPIIILPLLLPFGCSKPPPSDLSPALTAAAASNNNGAAVSTAVSTEAQTEMPRPTGTPQQENCRAESIQNSINMRRTPNGDIIGCCLARGEEVEILEVDDSGEWALIEGIEKPAHRGWVKLSLFEISGNCENMPAG